MAIFHYNMQMISRSAGRNAVAAAAYRSGQQLEDESTGQVKFYRRDVQPDAMILAPKNAPSWVYDRQTLWSEVEKKERRKDSQLAREMNIALPKELNHEEQKTLVHEFVQSQFVDQGMVADAAIHRDDENNPHFHLMLTTRHIDEEGFGKKNREWNPNFKNHEGNEQGYISEKNTILHAREQWANMANDHLEQAGVDERITHLRLEDQSLARIPTQHLGVARHHMEQRGIRTEVGDKNRAIEQHNAEVLDFHEEVKRLEEEKEIERDYRHVSETEKGFIDKADTYIQGTVTYARVQERLHQLDRWASRVKEDLKENPEKTNLKKQLDTIQKQKKAVTDARTAFENGAIRELWTLYDREALQGYTKDELVHIRNQYQKEGDIPQKRLPVVVEHYHDHQSLDQAKAYMDEVTYQNMQTELGKLRNWQHSLNRREIHLRDQHINPTMSMVELQRYQQSVDKENAAFERKADALLRANQVLEKQIRYKMLQLYPKQKGMEHISPREAHKILCFNKYYGGIIPLKDVQKLHKHPKLSYDQRYSLHREMNFYFIKKHQLDNNDMLKHQRNIQEGFHLDVRDPDIVEAFYEECRMQRDDFLPENQTDALYGEIQQSARRGHGSTNLLDQIQHSLDEAEREADQRAAERTHDAEHRKSPRQQIQKGLSL